MDTPISNIYGENEIGEGTKIAALCDIGNCTIGKNCNIQTMVSIPKGTVIEDDVFIGPGVNILNDKYPPSYGKHWHKVTIKKGASIGGNATILPGVTIGENAMVGAGSVVTKDVKKGATVYGNPAKLKCPNGLDVCIDCGGCDE
jgi:UDP-2-acetamido-3-amino-2,3-dideoxy-glucuronate N-acetyltransferase